MASIRTFASLLFLSALTSIAAAPCVAFDANFNLLAFGLGAKDYNAGLQDAWSSSEPHIFTSLSNVANRVAR